MTTAISTARPGRKFQADPLRNAKSQASLIQNHKSKAVWL